MALVLQIFFVTEYCAGGVWQNFRKSVDNGFSKSNQARCIIVPPDASIGSLPEDYGRDSIHTGSKEKTAHGNMFAGVLLHLEINT